MSQCTLTQPNNNKRKNKENGQEWNKLNINPEEN
jgi:hypothetical protein